MGLTKFFSSLVMILGFGANLAAAETINADVLATSGQGSNILGAIDLLWGSGVA